MSKPDLQIAVLQMELAWESPEQNYRAAEALLKSSVEAVDLIVLPEMFSTGFSMKPERIAEEMHGPSMYWMRKLAQHHNALIMGSLIIEEEGKYYNRFIAADSLGLVHQYDKIRLFSMTGEDVAYTAGTSASVFTWKGWRFLPQICYDLRFPEQVRAASSAQGHAFDILVYVANWPKARVGHWDNLLKARAIENQCYVIGANRVGDDKNGLEYIGHSAVINPKGDTMEQTDQAGVLQASLEYQPMEIYRTAFPAWRDI